MKGGEFYIKTKIIKITITVFILIFIISSYILFKDFLAYKQSNSSTTELIENVIEKEQTEQNNEEKIKIDWKKLGKINKDIVGWIKIEDTNINYPILKDNNDLKYLRHSFNGEYNINGSIFTLNNKPFQESETTIYGHNMKSNIMFSELEKYMKKEFLKEHPSFEIYTKEQNYKAIIFSCYSINVNKEENNIKLLDFEDKVEYYKNASEYSIKDVKKIKKIVKLSTCSYLHNHTTPTTERYYIVAKLEKLEK